ncbi:MAG: protein translocase subunit SecF [Pyrinomonadaceae bacterium]|nr:protein translocase subunit SecF [Pyrinomonadaceae bacterium]
MFEILKDVRIDWLAKRRLFISISVLLLLAGLASAVGRQLLPGGSDAFNLGVDFKGGTVITAKFKQRPTTEVISDTLARAGVRDAVVQYVVNKPDEVLIRLPQQSSGEAGAVAAEQGQIDLVGRDRVGQALATFGEQGGAELVGTDAVGPVAGRALRNQAIAVTLLALVGVLLYIASRFEWTYGAAAVITVFHDVLVTLGFFSVFQWEVDLTVVAALLTLVGFSVNDTIVTFDRIRENLRLHRRDSLYNITNEAINQTLSRTVITGGLVLLSVLAMVLFGGRVLRGFSLALLIGIIVGTYSTIAIASPIMVWWQQRLQRSGTPGAPTTERQMRPGRGSVKRRATAQREPQSASRP